MPQLDFSERRNDREQEYSLEDKKFLKIKVSQEIRQSKDRHYETPLPVISRDHLWLLRIKSKSFQENAGSISQLIFRKNCILD